MVISYLLPFTLSFVVEALVAILLGYKSRVMLAGLLFINLATNPAANFVFRVGSYYHMFPGNLTSILWLEVIVVILEWRFMNYMFVGRSRSIFLLSLVMNTVSFSVGLLIFHNGLQVR